jgi:proteic killer suppression protein
LRYNGIRYAITLVVIKSFAERQTRVLFETGVSRRWSLISRVAVRKLVQIDSVAALEELNVPPGNRLEALKGDRAGLHSIRINDQWRICFRWTKGGDAVDVEIVDYH